MKKTLVILQCTFLLLLSACASTSNEPVVNDEDKTAEMLYNEAYN